MSDHPSSPTQKKMSLGYQPFRFVDAFQGKYEPIQALRNYQSPPSVSEYENYTLEYLSVRWSIIKGAILQVTPAEDPNYLRVEYRPMSADGEISSNARMKFCVLPGDDDEIAFIFRRSGCKESLRSLMIDSLSPDLLFMLKDSFRTGYDISSDLSSAIQIEEIPTDEADYLTSPYVGDIARIIDHERWLTTSKLKRLHFLVEDVTLQAALVKTLIINQEAAALETRDLIIRKQRFLDEVTDIGFMLSDENAPHVETRASHTTRGRLIRSMAALTNGVIDFIDRELNTCLSIYQTPIQHRGPLLRVDPSKLTDSLCDIVTRNLVLTGDLRDLEGMSLEDQQISQLIEDSVNQSLIYNEQESNNFSVTEPGESDRLYVMKQKIERLEGQLKARESELSRTSGRLSERETVILQLEEDVRTERALSATNKERLNQLLSGHADPVLKTERDELKDRCDSLEQTIASLREENQTLQQRITEANQARQTKSNDVEEMREQRRRSSQERHQLRNSVCGLEIEVSRLKNDNESLQQANSTIMLNLDQVNLSLQATERRESNLENEVRSQAGEIDEYLSRIATLSEEVRFLQTTLSQERLGRGDNPGTTPHPSVPLRSNVTAPYTGGSPILRGSSSGLLTGQNSTRARFEPSVSTPSNWREGGCVRFSNPSVPLGSERDQRALLDDIALNRSSTTRRGAAALPPLNRGVFAHGASAGAQARSPTRSSPVRRDASGVSTLRDTSPPLRLGQRGSRAREPNSLRGGGISPRTSTANLAHRCDVGSHDEADNYICNILTGPTCRNDAHRDDERQGPIGSHQQEFRTTPGSESTQLPNSREGISNQGGGSRDVPHENPRQEPPHQEEHTSQESTNATGTQSSPGGAGAPQNASGEEQFNSNPTSGGGCAGQRQHGGTSSSAFGGNEPRDSASNFSRNSPNESTSSGRGPRDPPLFNMTRCDVLLRKAEDTIEAARYDVVLNHHQVEALNIPEIRHKLSTGFKQEKEAIKDLQELKYKLCECQFTHEETVRHACEVNDGLESTIEEIRDTISRVKSRADAERIYHSNADIDRRTEMPPFFEGGADPLHYYQWKKLMTKYMERARYTRADSEHLWEQRLTGRAKELIEQRQKLSHSLSGEEILKELREAFGVPGNIYNELINKIKGLNELPSVTGNAKWDHILRTYSKALSIVKQLQDLEEDNKGTVTKAPGLENIFESIVPRDAYNLYKSNIAARMPVLEAFISCLKENQRQANAKGNYAISAKQSKNQQFDEPDQRNENRYKGYPERKPPRNKTLAVHPGQSNPPVVNTTMDAESRNRMIQRNLQAIAMGESSGGSAPSGAQQDHTSPMGDGARPSNARGKNESYSKNRGGPSRPYSSQRGNYQEKERANRPPFVPQKRAQRSGMDDKKKCIVCREAGEGHPKRHGTHVFSRLGYPQAEFCPILLDLSIPERDELMVRFNICRICAYKLISPSHSEEECEVLEQFRRYHCRSPGCNKKLYLCGEHKELNEELANDREKDPRDYHGAPTTFVAMSFNPNPSTSSRSRYIRDAHNKIESSSFADKPDDPGVERPTTLATAPYELPFLYKGQKDLITAARKRGVVKPEPAGTPIYIYTYLVGEDNQELLVTFDTCSSYTLVRERVVGRSLMGAYVRLPERETLWGITGSVPVKNAVIIIPNADGSMSEITATVKKELLVNSQDCAEHEARLFRTILNNRKICPGHKLDHPKLNDPVSVLFGIKNSYLFPQMVHTTATGLALYKSHLKTRFSETEGSFCFGGNAEVIRHFNSRTDTRTLCQLAQDVGTQELMERIPEIDFHSSSHSQDESACHSESSEEDTRAGKKNLLVKPSGEVMNDIVECKSTNSQLLGRTPCRNMVNQAIQTMPFSVSMETEEYPLTDSDESSLGSDAFETMVTQMQDSSENINLIDGGYDIAYEPNLLEENLEEKGETNCFQIESKSLHVSYSQDKVQQASKQQVMSYAIDKEVSYYAYQFAEKMLSKRDVLFNLPMCNAIFDIMSHNYRNEHDRVQGLKRLIDFRIARKKTIRLLQLKRGSWYSSAPTHQSCQDERVCTSPCAHNDQHDILPELKLDSSSGFSRQDLGEMPRTLAAYDKLPLDEVGTIYLNKLVGSSFKPTQEELMNYLSGPTAERLSRCVEHADCRKCQSSNENREISVRAWREDLLFKNCARICPNSNRIICSLPLPVSYREYLPSNLYNTERRLKKELTKISRLKDSKNQIKEAWQKYRDRGFIKTYEELSPAEQEIVDKESLQHFLAVSIAYKANSLSSKARICMDGSMKSFGRSINSVMPVGSLNFNLPRNVQQFLTYPAVATGDVSTFYCSVGLEPSQYHIHQLRWIESLDPNDKAKSFYLVRLFFGLRPVSRLMDLAFELMAKKFPHLEEILTKSFYVDDLTLVAHNRQRLMQLKHQIIDCLKEHCFFFKGFAIFKEEPDEAIQDESGRTGILGVEWDSKADVCVMRIPKLYKSKKVKGQIESLASFEGNTVLDLKRFHDHAITPRQVLARAMSYWDPFGILSPVISRFRRLATNSLRIATGSWDEALPEDTMDAYCNLVLLLDQVKEYRYPRTSHSETNDLDRKFDIMAFSDAGEAAKVAIQYTRCLKTENEFSVSYLFSKNYLKKPIETIPKAELDALYKSSLLVEAERKNLSPHDGERHAFTDSMVVIGWLRNESMSLQTYQRIRVLHILNTFTNESGDVLCWYVRRDHNPSDVGTHDEATPESISPTSRFFNGPEFLRHNLDEAVAAGIITRMDKTSKQLTTEESFLFNDGIIHKLNAITPEVAAIEAKRSHAIKDVPHSTLATSNKPFMENIKRLFFAGKYLYNPLRKDFRKVITIHVIAFKFLINIMKRIDVRKRIEQPSSSIRFPNSILKKWSEETKHCVAFSQLATPSVDAFRVEMQIGSTIASINHQLNLILASTANAPEHPRAKALTTHWENSLRDVRISLQNEECSPQQSQDHLDDVNLSVSSFLLKLREKESDKEITLSNSTHSKTEQLERLSYPGRTWMVYPGFRYHYCNLRILSKLLKGLHENDGSFISLVHAIAIVICTSKFCQALLSHYYTRKMARFLEAILRNLISTVHQNVVDRLFDALNKFQKDAAVILNGEAPKQIFELSQWMQISSSSFIFPGSHNPADQPLPDIDPLIPRILLPKLIRTQDEFATLQLLTFNHFHEILTREIRYQWSTPKIKKHCRVWRGKYISNWRIRAGFEAADCLRDELAENGTKINTPMPSWPAMGAVGTADSPLVISLSLHLHREGSANPFGITKIFNHKGALSTRQKLMNHIYVPGVLKTLERIRDSCMMCQVRIQRFYQATIGDIPSASFNFAPYSHVHFDALGPLKVKLRKGDRLTRSYNSGKAYLILFVDICTKHLTIELVEDLSTDSIVCALTRLSCQHRFPAHIYTDRHATHVSILRKMATHEQVNNVLLRTKNIRYTFAPVGDHHQAGLVERRCRSVGDMVGALNLNNHPISITELQTFLLSISETINWTALGVALEETDPLLQMICPAILIGKFQGRQLTKPLSIPEGVSQILRSHEARWEAVMKVYADCVIPALLKNKKWSEDKHEQPDEGSLVMFRKRIAPWSPEWSLGRVSKVYTGRDNKVRSICVEYVGARDTRATEDSAATRKQDVKGQIGRVTRTYTIRDSNAIIILHPLCNSIEDDLTSFHFELEASEEEFTRHSVRCNSPATLMSSTENCGTVCSVCSEHRRFLPCQLCELLSRRDLRRPYKVLFEKISLEIYCPENIMDQLITRLSSAESLYQFLRSLVFFGGEIIGYSQQQTVQDGDEGFLIVKSEGSSDIRQKVYPVLEPIRSTQKSANLKDRKIIPELRRTNQISLSPELVPSLEAEALYKSRVKLQELFEESPKSLEPGCTTKCCCKNHCYVMHLDLEETTI